MKYPASPVDRYNTMSDVDKYSIALSKIPDSPEMNFPKFIFSTILLCSSLLGPTQASRYYQSIHRQTADFNEGSLPSNLPSPPQSDAPAPGPVPPTAEMSTTTTTEAPEEEESEEEPAPFGFEETILILVPQFKYKINGLPKWCGASVKLSFPITIFFDELDWPKGFNTLGFLLGRGLPPMKRRSSRSILSLPPAGSFPGGERATLIPKLEKTLLTSGGGGKACLLRSVCEVHAAKVKERYGFLGEIMARLFSISHSAYAETHLPGYLEAEVRGKAGNCSQYYHNCSHSLFEADEPQGPKYCRSGAEAEECKQYL